MDRKEVCQKIRDLNLQDAVKQHYGDNYTRVSTDKLVKLIQAYDQPTQKAPVTKPVAAPKKAATAEVSSTYEAACLVFLGLLKDNGLLDDLLKKL